MDWSLFLSVTIASALLVFPGFEILQSLAIKRGDIPPRGISEWQGKAFYHWDKITTQRYGDLVFFSILNGLVVAALVQMEPPFAITTYLAFIALGAVITIWWTRSLLQAAAEGDLNRWDSGLTAPGKLTLLGKYHVLYFWLEATIMSLSIPVLFSDVAYGIKISIIVVLFCYALTVVRDVKRIDLNGLRHMLYGSNGN